MTPDTRRPTQRLNPIRPWRHGNPSVGSPFASALALLATLSLLAPAWAQTALTPGTPNTPARTAERTAQVWASWARRIGFSGTALVAVGDQVLLHRGVGEASAEWGVPNGPPVKYLLASVSKQFTAAALLKLADEGRLRLDDPVRQHLPELPAAWQAITVRQLLAHTSGIPEHTAGEAFEASKGRAWTPRELLASFSTKPLEFAPSTRFRYSNSGYVVAGLLIEKLCQMPYGDCLRSRLFEPLKMNHTGLAHGEALTPRLATGYRRAGRLPATHTVAAPGSAAPAEPPRLLRARLLHLSVTYAAGALYGSAADLLTWQQALYGGRVLSATSLRDMTTPVRDGYALGLGVTGEPAAPVYSHSGAIDGFSSYLLFDRSAGVSVALLSNLEGQPLERMARQLAQAAAGRPVQLPEERARVELSASDQEALTGGYEHPRGRGLFWVARSGGQLWAREGQGGWQRLQAESPVRFYAPDIDGELLFERDTNGRAVALTPLGGTDALAWKRTEQPLPSLHGQTIYLRGSLNQWGTQDRLQDLGQGRYSLSLDWPAGTHEFKLASEDWSQVDLGDNDGGSALAAEGSRVVRGERALSAQGRNLVLHLATAARCQLELDGRDVVRPVLRWACPSP